MKSYKGKPVEQRGIAREEIKKSFEAGKVKKARRIAMKYKIKLNKTDKIKFCKKCNTLFNSKTLRVRKTKKGVTYTCLSCGDVRKQ